MKIISINLSSFGSTGKIMREIHYNVAYKGNECLAMVPASKKEYKAYNEENIYFIGHKLTRRINAYLGIMTGLDGCFSVFSTLKALIRVSKFKPDIIHLHNLHGTYINIPMLMWYIKRHKIRVVWTLHDCWAFTGHCPHFAYERCDKWKKGCNHCPRYRIYPKSLFDNSLFMWKLKKKWFTGIENLTIVTPSKWLADLVKESYLKDYTVHTIHNGIDLNIFKPTESDFRVKYHIPENKKIVLGVAFGWGEKKGMDIFMELSKRFDENFQIVMVGTNDSIDEQLGENIISIHRTQNQFELAEIYSASDVFVNPTREEVLGLTNIEANACGIPVVTFRSGGSPECIDDTCGVVVECDDIESLYREILRICEKKPYSKENCIKRAISFSVFDMVEKYLSLYENNKIDVYIENAHN